MSWVTRGECRYYYRSVRINGRPVRVYLGSGASAQAAAAEVEQRQRERRMVVKELRDTAERYRVALAPLLELCALTDLLITAILVGEGYHKHARGQWRKRSDRHNNR